MQLRLLFFSLAIIIISCNSVDPEFDAIGDIEMGKIQLITYGLIFPAANQPQLDSLAAHYGFKYDNRGCNVDSATILKANEYNKIVISHIAKKFGNSWYRDYTRVKDSMELIGSEHLFKVK